MIKIHGGLFTDQRFNIANKIPVRQPASNTVHSLIAHSPITYYNMSLLVFPRLSKLHFTLQSCTNMVAYFLSTLILLGGFYNSSSFNNLNLSYTLSLFIFSPSFASLVVHRPFLYRINDRVSKAYIQNRPYVYWTVHRLDS